jgi:hypothetical protein
MTLNPDSMTVSVKAPTATLFDDETNGLEISLFRFIINKKYDFFQF